MRSILFRGKHIATGDWYLGSLLTGVSPSILPVRDDGDYFQSRYMLVHPETVGQYIGIDDCQGRAIFEGDTYTDAGKNPCEVVWFKNGCEFLGRYLDGSGCEAITSFVTVTGNIHKKEPNESKEDK